MNALPEQAMASPASVASASGSADPVGAPSPHRSVVAGSTRSTGVRPTRSTPGQATGSPRAHRRGRSTGPAAAGLVPDRYLTPQEVADTLQVPVETVYRWRKQRTGPPGFRVGKHLRYDPAALAAWVQARTTGDTGREVTR